MENMSTLCSTSLSDQACRLVDLLALSDHIRLKVCHHSATSPSKLLVGLSYLSKVWVWEFTVGSKSTMPPLSLSAEMVFGTSDKEIVDWVWAEKPTLVRALYEDGSCVLLSNVKTDPSQRYTRNLSTFEDYEVLSLLEIADAELLVLCKSSSSFHFYYVSQRKPEYLCSLPKLENEPCPYMCIVSMDELSSTLCAQLVESDAARIGGKLLVIGSDSGDVYGFPLNRQSGLRILCRLYQPLVGTFVIESRDSGSSSGLLFVGQEGKLLMVNLQGSSTAIRTDFLNRPIMQCCYFRNMLLVNVEGSIRRVKIEPHEKAQRVSDKFISEDHCYPLKSVRELTVIPYTIKPIVVVLTEDAIVYTFHFDLPGQAKPQLSLCMDTIMGQLECIGLEMKYACERRIRTTERFEQSSLALRLLNLQNLEELIVVDMRTYPVTSGVDEEYILLDVENKSQEIFLPGYWSLCIGLGSKVISCLLEPLIKPWRPAEVMHINRRIMKLWESDEDVSFHLSLQFVVDDTFIPIPVCSAIVNMFNFLEPSSSHLGANTAEGQSFEDFLLDVAMAKPAAPLFRQLLRRSTDQTNPSKSAILSMSSELSLTEFVKYLLEGSYHRGFEHVELEGSAIALHLPLRVGEHRLEIDLMKQEDAQLCVIRVVCCNMKLLRRTVKIIIEKIGFLTPSEVTLIPIRDKSVDEMKRLKRKFDFTVALPNVELSLMTPIMDHFKEVFVNHFSVH